MTNASTDTSDGGSYNVSELMELVTDGVGDREAIVSPARRLTYAELDARANRLAHHLAESGVEAEDHIGLQLVNGTEYLEGMLAAFKLRAVPVNVNYRYVERELEYLFDNADLKALVFNRAFSPQVGVAAAATPGLGHLLVVDDDSGEAAPDQSVDYEQALTTSSPARPGHARARAAWLASLAETSSRAMGSRAAGSSAAATCACAMPVFRSTPSAPSSIASVTSLGVPTPASTITG